MTDREHEGMKKCSKCGEWKPATAEYFYRDNKRTDGLQLWCRECRSECDSEYYQKNKERCLEYRSEYRQKNKDRIREYDREYRQKNKEKLADQEREYYQKNKERCLEYRSEYYQKNKEKLADQEREYRQKNKDRIREYDREYRQSPVGRLLISVEYLRRKTGATIYLRDMTEEQKETLANQYVAVRTLEKTEKELLAASGKKRCTKCDRVLDYDCFYKKNDGYAGLCAYCKDCQLKRKREYYQQKKQKST